MDYDVRIKQFPVTVPPLWSSGPKYKDTRKQMAFFSPWFLLTSNFSVGERKKNYIYLYIYTYSRLFISSQVTGSKADSGLEKPDAQMSRDL